MGFCGHKTPHALIRVAVLNKLTEVFRELIWSMEVIHAPYDRHLTQTLAKHKGVLSPFRVTSMVVPSDVPAVEYHMFYIVALSPCRSDQKLT